MVIARERGEVVEGLGHEIGEGARITHTHTVGMSCSSEKPDGKREACRRMTLSTRLG